MRSEIVKIDDDYFVLLPQELIDAAGISGPVVVSCQGGRIIIARDAEGQVTQGG